MKLGERTVIIAIILTVTMTMLVAPAVAYQPRPPMVAQGFVYIDGVRAEDNTLVEARISGETVASFHTTTAEGKQGYYVLQFEGEEGDEVGFLVNGEAAQVLIEGEPQGGVPYEPGFHTYDLVVGASPRTYVLTMAARGNGITVPELGEHLYPEGSAVRIGAISDEGWQFDGWTGEVADPNSVNTVVTLDADKTVTANFAPAPTPSPTPPPGATEPVTTPTASPTSTATPTPSPTNTPTPVPSPTPTGTPGPSPTPSRTPTPIPTSTSIPTSTPEPVIASPTPLVLTVTAPTGGAASSAETSAPSTPSPTPSSPTEGGGERRGLPDLVFVAIGLAVVGVAAIGFGVLSLKPWRRGH